MIFSKNISELAKMKKILTLMILPIILFLLITVNATLTIINPNEIIRANLGEVYSGNINFANYDNYTINIKSIIGPIQLNMSMPQTIPILPGQNITIPYGLNIKEAGNYTDYFVINYQEEMLYKNATAEEMGIFNGIEQIKLFFLIPCVKDQPCKQTPVSYVLPNIPPLIPPPINNPPIVINNTPTSTNNTNNQSNPINVTSIISVIPNVIQNITNTPVSNVSNNSSDVSSTSDSKWDWKRILIISIIVIVLIVAIVFIVIMIKNRME